MEYEYKGSNLPSPKEENLHKNLVKNGNNLQSINNPFTIGKLYILI